MVFSDKNDMADYLEQNLLGGGQVVSVVEDAALDVLDKCYKDELSKWMQKAGIEESKYFVDDYSLKAALKDRTEQFAKSLAKRQSPSMARSLAGQLYTEPVPDSYDRGGWMKDYSHDELENKAVSFAAGYFGAMKMDVEASVRSICKSQMGVNPPVLYTKANKNVEVDEADRISALNEEAAAERAQHPKKDGETSYCFADVKKSILVMTTDGSTAGYSANFSTGVKRPPVFGKAGTGIRFSVKSDGEHGFIVSAQDAKGRACESSYSRDEILSMERGSFEEKAFAFEAEREKSEAVFER